MLRSYEINKSDLNVYLLIFSFVSRVLIQEYRDITHSANIKIITKTEDFRMIPL